MNSVKVLLALCLLSFCGILSTTALRCLTCSGPSSCKSPKKYECNVDLGNDSMRYLSLHYDGANVTTPTSSYYCFADELHDTTGETEYKGCVFSNVAPCSLLLSSYHNNVSYTRTCSQCVTDYCNPAGRASVSFYALVAVISLSAIGKRLFAL